MDAPMTDHAKLQLALQDLAQREQLADALCDGLFIDPRLAQVRQRCSCHDLRTVARVLAERITDAHELRAKAVKILDGLCNKDFEPSADDDEAFQRLRGRLTAPAAPPDDALRRELSSVVRSILTQGHAQQMDYAAGKYPLGYEEFCAHFESTIAPRVEQLLAAIKEQGNP